MRLWHCNQDVLGNELDGHPLASRAAQRSGRQALGRAAQVADATVLAFIVEYENCDGLPCMTANHCMFHHFAGVQGDMAAAGR